MLNSNATLAAIVPLGMEGYRQFINCRLRWNDTAAKHDKIPVTPLGREINSQNPANWLSASEASQSEFPIAFVLTRDDPFFCLDFDNCLRDGQLSDIASQAISYFNGAAFEISHSSRGIHLFGSGSGAIPANHRTRRAGLPFELYTHSRFILLSGMNKCGSALIDFSAQLRETYQRFDLAPVEAIADAGVIDPRYTFTGDDTALVSAMCAQAGSAASAFGGKAQPRDLWQGDVAALRIAFPQPGREFDASAADMALMMHLAYWTGRDVPRMIGLFRMSALASRLGRKSSPEGYLTLSATKAAGLVKSVYDRPQPAASPGSAATAMPGSAERYMLLAAQQEHFAGCVYVERHHAVMLPDGDLAKPEQFRAVKGGYEFQMQADGARPTRNAFEAFTESRIFDFPKCKDIYFAPLDQPGNIRKNRVNTWIVEEIEEAPGDVTPFLEHLNLLLPNERDRLILLCYIAAVVKYQGVKFRWAPIIQGVQGNGKSLIRKVIAYAIGDRHSYSPKASQISEKFNQWLIAKTFIGVEEIYIAERREILESLKEPITESEIEIRFVGGHKAKHDNYANWLFLTNHKDAVPITRNERRWAPFFTAQQEVDDLAACGMTTQYFLKLYRWLQDGGYAVVSHYLRNFEIPDEFNPATDCVRAPLTSATNEAIGNSLGRIEQEICEAIAENKQGFRSGWISTGAISQLMIERNLRSIGPRKQAEIIKSLGYTLISQSATPIIQEGNRRVRIYRAGIYNGRDVTGDYMRDQGYFK